eukprot:ANDGO_08064.mRNA.1 hypothetical protein NAEGRDRAFT_78620
MSESDWVLDSIVSFLRSPLWQTPIQNFVDENCTCFPAEQSIIGGKMEAGQFAQTDIHTQFQELVENLLETYLSELGISNEDFITACANSSNPELSSLVLEYILAMDDFVTFKKLMEKRNMELEIEALKVLKNVINRQHMEDRDAKLAAALEKGDEDEVKRIMDEIERENEEASRSIRDEAVVAKSASGKQQKEAESDEEAAIAKAIADSMQDAEVQTKQKTMEEAEVERVIAASMQRGDSLRKQPSFSAHVSCSASGSASGSSSSSGSSTSTSTSTSASSSSSGLSSRDVARAESVTQTSSSASSSSLPPLKGAASSKELVDEGTSSVDRPTSPVGVSSGTDEPDFTDASIPGVAASPDRRNSKNLDSEAETKRILNEFRSSETNLAETLSLERVRQESILMAKKRAKMLKKLESDARAKNSSFSEEVGYGSEEDSVQTQSNAVVPASESVASALPPPLSLQRVGPQPPFPPGKDLPPVRDSRRGGAGGPQALSNSTANSTSTSPVREVLAEPMSEEDMRRRQEYLRAQRDKIISERTKKRDAVLLKTPRESILGEAGSRSPSNKSPETTATQSHDFIGRSPPRSGRNDEEELAKRMEVRIALAQRVKEDLRQKKTT